MTPKSGKEGGPRSNPQRIQKDGYQPTAGPANPKPPKGGSVTGPSPQNPIDPGKK